MRKLIALLLGLAIVILSPLPAQAFSDTVNHWAVSYINHMYARGIVNGRTSTRFVPDSRVTRAEFATLLIQGLGLSQEAKTLQKGKCFFSDIPSSYWAKGNLEFCREMGIMEADQSARCRPNDTINRAEAAVMLVKALNLSGSSRRSFSDESIIPSWAKDSAAILAGSGIIIGYPDGSFGPNNYLTRAQAAVIIEKMLEYRGERYSGYGSLKSLNMSQRQAIINVGGQAITFNLANRYIFVPLHERGTLKFPLNCYFDFNNEGKLVYCQETTQPPDSSLNISATTMAQKQVSKTAAKTGLASGETMAVSAKAEQADPRVSSLLNTQEVRAKELREQMGLDGKGIKIAIIDTGIDPGHPDLVKNPDGKTKIKQWIDLTDTGRITLAKASIIDGQIILPDSHVGLGKIPYRGQIMYGFWEPGRLPVRLRDVGNQPMLVVVFASKQAGVFDTVIVDTDADSQLTDESPMTKYGLAHQYGTLITTDNKPFNYVISEIDTRGTYIKFGFDSNGHGTKVAGVIAANGLMYGVAPAAEIICIKVTDGYDIKGTADLKKALLLLNQLGVQAANISLGYNQLSEAEQSGLEQTINQVTESSGINICVSYGNCGPGLGTGTAPSGAKSSLGIGGYISPLMWLNYYGWQISQNTLWNFCSVGPDGTGGGPLLVAPASAVTTNCRWLGDYSFDEGTSIAAPYVTGGIALLLQAAQKDGINPSPSLIRGALAHGAAAIPNYLPCEAGYGTLNLVNAWNILKQNGTGLINQGSGIFNKTGVPELTYLEIDNPGKNTDYLHISSNQSWLKITQRDCQVPANSKRFVKLEYSDPGKPGLYSGFIRANDESTSGNQIDILNTVVVPVALKGGVEGTTINGELPAGIYRRYFFKVPVGTGTLSLKVKIDRTEKGDFLGRVRMYLLDPQGNLVESTGYAGNGYPETSAEESLAVSRTNPAAGVWEMIVFSSVTLSQYNLAGSKYNITAELLNWKDQNLVNNGEYLITSAPPLLTPGVERLVTLYFWNKSKKVMGEGWVIINDRLYQMWNGRVCIKV
ncbi:MAG: S-layer homology domain-containing protein, partial [Chitinophagales bacterium]